MISNPVPVSAVNVPAAGVLAPITLLFTVPPTMVKSLSTYPSAIDVAVHAPEVTVPVVVIDVIFPVVSIVPLTFGIVMVLSAVGSVTEKLVSYASAVAPSNSNGVAPDKVPIDEADTSVHERVPLPLVFNT